MSRVILADCCYTTPKLFLTSTWPALPWLRRPELPEWAESQEKIEGGLASLAGCKLNVAAAFGLNRLAMFLFG